jgi:hypothetical protein
MGCDMQQTPTLPSCDVRQNPGILDYDMQQNPLFLTAMCVKTSKFSTAICNMTTKRAGTIVRGKRGKLALKVENKVSDTLKYRRTESNQIWQLSRLSKRWMDCKSRSYERTVMIVERVNE